MLSLATVAAVEVDGETFDNRTIDGKSSPIRRRGIARARRPVPRPECRGLCPRVAGVRESSAHPRDGPDGDRLTLPVKSSDTAGAEAPMSPCGGGSKRIRNLRPPVP